MVLTSLVVTHSNILSSKRSSMPRDTPSQRLEVLPYRTEISQRTRNTMCFGGWARVDLNHRPPTWNQAGALTNWATGPHTGGRKTRETRTPILLKGRSYPCESGLSSFRSLSFVCQKLPLWNFRTHAFGTMLSPDESSAHPTLPCLTSLVTEL